MTALPFRDILNFEIPTFDDYVATLTEEEQAKLSLCIGRCSGIPCGNFCTGHLQRWNVMQLDETESFCDANQHIVPAIAAYLKVVNPEIHPSFFCDASRIPLVLFNYGRSPAWEFDGKKLEYHPGTIALDTFSANMRKLEEIEYEAYQLMDPCCRNRECRDHFTEASARSKETTRMRSSYTTPIKRFSIITGKEI